MHYRAIPSTSGMKLLLSPRLAAGNLSLLTTKPITALTHQIQIFSTSLDIQSAIGWILSPESGGIDVFIGTVRNSTKGKAVVRLEFEAYEPMALAEMEKIANQAFEKWPVQKVLIHHRIGILEVGEVPVIIAVSAAHRA